VNGDTIEGVVYVYDAGIDVIGLEVGNDIVLLAASQCSNITLVTRGVTSSRDLPALDMPKLAAKETTALAERAADAAKYNANVDALSQRIFDAISKTIKNVRWDGNDMIVMDSVLIKPPHTPQTCTGGSNVMRNRVKKIVESERHRSGQPTQQ